jgi:hypothetical protein
MIVFEFIATKVALNSGNVYSWNLAENYLRATSLVTLSVI